MLEEFPAALYPWCGRGVKSWQYPRQFSRYLRFIADKQIQTYVEIGSRHGGEVFERTGKRFLGIGAVVLG